MKNLKVIFMGTPDFSVPIFKKLIELTNVILVVTQPDSFTGRKKILTQSPIKQIALDNNIEVFTPNKIRQDYEKILNTEADIIITCAYGQIIPKIILDYPRLKCINVHASLLPKYRGGSPIQAAILNGEEESGITIMYMAEGVDDGNIIKQQSIRIEEDDDYHTLSDKLSLLGADLLIDTLPSIINGTNESIEQNKKKVTYGYIIKREEEKIIFNDIYKNINNKVKALYNRSYFILNKIEYKVIKTRFEKVKGNINEINNIYKDGIGIGCLDGEVVITEFIPSGKKQMLVSAYLNGKDKTKLIGSIINE